MRFDSRFKSWTMDRLCLEVKIFSITAKYKNVDLPQLHSPEISVFMHKQHILEIFTRPCTSTSNDLQYTAADYWNIFSSHWQVLEICLYCNWLPNLEIFLINIGYRVKKSPSTLTAEARNSMYIKLQSLEKLVYLSCRV